jgi:hypothetical protein
MWVAVVALEMRGGRIVRGGLSFARKQTWRDKEKSSGCPWRLAGSSEAPDEGEVDGRGKESCMTFQHEACWPRNQ